MSEIINITAIRLDGGTQARAASDTAAIQDYARAMGEGATFPPVVLFQDGPDLWLADGFHRVAAAHLAGLEEIAADIQPGTRRDALLFSVGSNQTHGVRRTNADKRSSVAHILDDAEWCQWSDREIARRAGVSNVLVSKMRGEQVLTVNTPEAEPDDSTPDTAAEGELPAIFATPDSDFIGKVTVAGIELTALISLSIVNGKDTGRFYALILDPSHRTVEEMRRPINKRGLGRFLDMGGFPMDEARWEAVPMDRNPMMLMWRGE